MNPTHYAAAIAIFILAALVLRMFGPKGDFTWLVSPGVYRGYPLNVLASRFFVIIAIAVAVAYFVKRTG
jgi:hypothetical protein